MSKLSAEHYPEIADTPLFDCVMRLCDPDEKTRLTWDEALNHECFKGFRRMERFTPEDLQSFGV